MKKENCCSDMPFVKSECRDIMPRVILDIREPIKKVERKGNTYTITIDKGLKVTFIALGDVKIKKGDYLEIKDGKLRVTFKKALIEQLKKEKQEAKEKALKKLNSRK